jgi:Polysaccharide pyruvyl transferase
MLIELQGAEFSNTGAAMMCLSAMERLRRTFHDVEFAMVPGPNCDYREIARIGAWQRFRLHSISTLSESAVSVLPSKWRRLTRRHGVVLADEVDAVLDLSGFAYGKPWQERSQERASRDIARLAKKGRPYIFLPQAFGVFSGSEKTTKRFRDALLSADLIFARDEQSLKNLESLVTDHSDAMRLCPDFTLEFPLKASPSDDPATAYDLVVVPSSKLGSEIHGHSTPREWIEFFLFAIQKATSEGKSVLIVNHCDKEDADICRHLSSVTNIPTYSGGNPETTKALIRSAAMVISGRYHACVSALSGGVPCISASWSHKYTMLFREFGVENYVAPSPDRDKLAALIDKANDEKLALAKILMDASTNICKKVDVMWDEVTTVLRR